DLPVPLRPTTPTRQPACRARSTSDRRRRSPRRRAKFRKAIMGRGFYRTHAGELIGTAASATLHPRPRSAFPRMHHDTDLINIVAVGLAVAFVLGALANRLRLSPLVGYLVAGICVGPFTPGFVADQE